MFKVLISSLMLASIALAQPPDLEPRYHSSRILVRFKPGVAQVAKGSALRAAGAVRVMKEYKLVKGLQLVEVPTGKVRDVIRAYLKNPNVEYAEPDYERYATTYCADPCIECGAPPDTEDPGFVNQWGMVKINAEQAWCFFGGWTGSSGFKIAVLDSGVGGHQDLVSNRWHNPGEIAGNNIDDDGNGYIDDVSGWDFVDNDNDPADEDMDFHGSHVAGILGAEGNNSKGVAGVNWECDIVRFRILPRQSEAGFVSWIISAIDYMVVKNIKVSNNSWGGLGFSQCMYDAIKEAGEQIGHIFVTSAGNKSRDIDITPSYPEAYDLPYIITVAATEQNDSLLDIEGKGSNWGLISVDLGAPGKDIYSTTSGFPVPLYGYLSGTSMAAPHVAGVVALVWSRHPTWDWRMVRDRVLWTVDPVTSLDPDGSTPTVTGGIVDALAAVWDCNGNNVKDETDIGNGTSTDCTGNGTPDECEPDCNTNGVADSCDIDDLTSEDCNSNGVPDECDCETPVVLDACNMDCNGNSIHDFCDIEGGTSQDCNNNGVPDECDPDCDGDGVPDECDSDCCLHADCGSGELCCGYQCMAVECCDDADCPHPPFLNFCCDNNCQRCCDDSDCFGGMSCCGSVCSLLPC